MQKKKKKISQFLKQLKDYSIFKYIAWFHCFQCRLPYHEKDQCLIKQNRVKIFDHPINKIMLPLFQQNVQFPVVLNGGATGGMGEFGLKTLSCIPVCPQNDYICSVHNTMMISHKNGKNSSKFLSISKTLFCFSSLMFSSPLSPGVGGAGHDCLNLNFRQNFP